jgi:diguanylate cyclase (GGDEF)-like protein/PAS domain S-box-containing protein
VIEGADERILRMLNAAVVGIWECDLGTGRVWWVGDMQALFGRSPESFDGTLSGFLQMVHPEDHVRLSQAVEVALGRGGLYEAEFRTVLPDGRLRWLGERGRVLQDASGQPKHILGIVQDITERKAIEDSLLLQALHDPLTGLPNRVLLRERVEQALKQRPDGTYPALFVLDLDGFKEVNDRFGHPAGDHVLREVASRWRALLRRGETLARLGGDEFAVLAPRLASREAASRIGGRLLRRLDSPFQLDGCSIAVGVSVGIALYPDHGRDLESLLSSADQAMYQAKRTRSGCAVFAERQPG